MSDVFLTREEIEHPYANLAVMMEDKRRKAEQMSETVFVKITASPEVLAPCFVEKHSDQWDDDDYAYYSYLTKEWYATEDKAIAATVAKLKEVAE